MLSFNTFTNEWDLLLFVSLEILRRNLRFFQFELVEDGRNFKNVVNDNAYLFLKSKLVLPDRLTR